MAKPFQPTPHAVWGLPSPELSTSLPMGRWEAIMQQREELIAAEARDPLRHFWEPPIWKVCDALLGFPWVDATWAAAMRKHLGFPKLVRQLTILGGNRGGKTQYCVTRALRLMLLRGGMSVWFWHESVKMSVDLHQKEFYRYLPPELKQADIKSKEAYIAYKRKTGFSDMSFILPAQGGLSDLTFKTYGEPTIEGANLDLVVLDELTGREATHAEIAETMPLRVAERDGAIIKPFTPVEGYSETVRMDLDGATTVQESIAFLLPKDGGEPDLPRALGLTEDELIELHRAGDAKRAALFPQSRPENCEAWISTAAGHRPALPQMEIPEGREFERTPRVLKCFDPEEQKAVVFFHSSDNPYGNPKSVVAKIRSRNKPAWFMKERFYGVAHKTIAARFTFDRAVHVVPAEAVPENGTNYHLADPHSSRNIFMLWFRVTPEHVYVYREWPGDYYIPGVGVPGPWAVPGPKPDGMPGPAQKSFGWGLRDYKREIARLEGWSDYIANAECRMQNAETQDKPIDEWSSWNGAKEAMEERELDARFASTPRLEKDRPVTLLTEFEDIGLTFNGMPGDDIDTGLLKIDDALNYDTARPVGFFNQPRLLISAACANTIYALETWTGKTAPTTQAPQGRTEREGATKEPIDCLKAFFLRPRPYLGGPEETVPAGEERKEYY